MAVTRVSRSRKAQKPNGVRKSPAPPEASFASEICWAQDAGLRFTRIGAFATRMSGLSAEAFLGKCRWELPHAGVSEAGWAEHRRALEARQPFSEFEYGFRGVDGGLTWLSVSGEPCFDADGAFAGYRGIAFDITQRRKKEAAAGQREECLLREAIDALDAPIALTDAEDRIVLVNRAFAAQYPEGAGTAIGKPYEQYLRDSIVPNYAPDAKGREDEWVAARMARRSGGASRHEQLRPNGVWHLIVDQRLTSGATITFNLDITERKRAEEALLARNRLLDAILDSIPDAVAFTDGKTGEVIVNENLYTFFGLDRAAALAHGNPVEYGLHQMALRGEYGPGDPEALVRERIAMVVRRVAESGGFSYERQLRSGRWIETRIIRIDGSGRLALYRDITSEKRRTVEIEAQALLLKTTFSAMSEGISVFDADLRLSACNARFGELTGIDPALLAPGTLLRDMLVAQARAGEFGLCDPHTEAERRIARLWLRDPIVVERVRPDGRVIEVRRSPIPAGGYVTVFVDITERRRAENALLESQARFETLFRSSPTPAAILRETGGHLECNDAYCAFMGFSREQIVGHYGEESGFTRNVEERRRAFEAFAAAGRLDGYATTVYNASGEGREVLVYAEHTSWLDGAAVLVQMVDISKRLAAETAVRELNRTLEARVAERTASLAESEARLRQVLDALPHAVNAKDAAGRYLLANRAVGEFLGRPREELLGRTLTECGAAPEEAALIEAEEAMVRASGHALASSEVSLTDSAGRARHHLATRMPIRFSAEAPDAVLSISVDITKRRKMELELRESRARFEALVDLMPAGLMVHDHGKVRYVNREMLRVAGATDATQILGRNLLEFLEPRMRAKVAARMEALYCGEPIPPIGQFPFHKLDGTRIDVESSSALVKEEGRSYVLTVARDITESKAAARALKESESRMRAVLDALPHLIYVKDREGRYLLANRASAEYLGQSSEKLIGRTFADVARNPADAVPIEERDAQVRAAGLTAIYPAQQISDRAGRTRFFSATRVPMRFSARHPDALLGILVDVTERRAMEQDLRDTHEYLETLIDLMPDAVIIHDSGVVRYANREAERINAKFGDRPLVGSNLLDRFEPEIRAGIAERFDRLYRTGGVTPGRELRVPLRSGGFLEIESSAALISEKGTPRILMVFRDITERKRKDEALRAREEQLRIVAEHIPALVARYDRDMICRYSNSHYARTVGRTAEDMVGMKFEDIVGPVRAQEEKGRVSRALKGETVRFERSSHDGRGASDITLVPYRGPDGGQDGYFAFAVDITERKQNEERVRESRERLRQVIDLVPHFVFAKDAQNRYLFANAAYARAYGISTEEIVGKTSVDIGMSEAEAALVNSVDARIRETGEQVELTDQRVEGPDGVERTFWNVRMPINYSADAPNGVLAVATDITALKNAQAEVEKLNADLEARVVARTAELVAVNTELESFSYSISHDLRAPVRAVIGFTDHVIRTHGASLPTDAARLLDRVLASGMRMGAMIDGLLELARLARSSVRRASVDLAAVAREIWAETAAAEPRREIAFLAPERCLAECDPVLIRNVLQNLLGNAFKYTRRTPAARVEFGEFGEGRVRVFFVRDNGAGFDMAYADRLFEIFQRLHGASEFEGSGVGLATVKRIVERHGGKIWAEAGPGEGASFQFTLGSGKTNA